MDIYMIKWPDESCGIIAAWNKTQLFDEMDKHGPPMDAMFKELDGLNLNSDKTTWIDEHTGRELKEDRKTDRHPQFDNFSDTYGEFEDAFLSEDGWKRFTQEEYKRISYELYGGNKTWESFSKWWDESDEEGRENMKALKDTLQTQ